MDRMVPCPVCKRHVKMSEGECPFCASALDFAGVSPRELPRERMSRAASFAFGATVVGVLSGACGDTVPVYGAPAMGGQPGAGGQSGLGGGSFGGGIATGGASSGGGSPSAGAGADTGGDSGAAGDGGAGGDATTGGNGNGFGGSVPIYGAPPRP